MDNDLLRQTRKHFETINFSEMSENWIDEAIAYEFTDVQSNPMSIGILFANDPIQTLLNISKVCEAWIRKGMENDLEESHTGDVSTRPEEVFWTYLDEMEIEIKHILGAIYFLCTTAMKTASTLDEKQIGLLSAKWYFSSLRVPGSTAYSVYNPSLFRVCLDCFQVPSLVESRDARYQWKHFEQILPTFSCALESLVPLLSTFHLGTDTSTIDYVIQKLNDLVGSEISTGNISFDLDFLAMPEKERSRRFSRSMVAASLAYQGFTTLLNCELNGEKEYTYNIILSQLNQHILCTRIKKASTIPVKLLNVKDHAVAFVCHNLQSKDALISELTLTTLKRLCLCVSDRAEFRNAVSHAVFTVMFRLRVEDLAELIQWILLLSDASESYHRVFALEMLGLLLNNIPQVDTEGLPESMEVYLTPVPIIFSILTRCDDLSPVVRTKALGMISQNMTKALNVLTEMQEPAVFHGEVFEDELDYRFNGDHRSFWYNFTAFQDVLKEIAGIFHRHIEDTNGIARRAALQALESVINFDHAYLTTENLKLFSVAAKDPIIVMRKQTVQSLTMILEKYPNDVLSQEYWLKCVLPLVQDPENSVQAKVLGSIEEKFLIDVFSDNTLRQDAAFCLLRKIAFGEFLSHQRYLQKAFSCWKADKKLRPQMANKLERCLNHGNDEMIWLYLSIFAAFSKLPSNMYKLAMEEFEKPLNWDSPTFLENILKIIGCSIPSMQTNELESIGSVLTQKLKGYAVPVEIIPNVIDILSKIENRLDRQNELSELSTDMITSSVDMLSPLAAASRRPNAAQEDLAIKSFTVVKEFCHYFPANITTNLINLLKKFVCKPNAKAESADTSTTRNKKMNPTLQAHAYAALGKISLQQENLAIELLPHLARELRLSNEDRIRNNIVIILIEMCKRYTSFADKYIPLIITCFKDKCYVIRHQSITLIVGLLQEDYIKCKGPLLQCILSTIIDKKEAIQELGKFCLLQLLLPKKKSIFFDHFADTIFILNGFQPPRNARVQVMVQQLDRFVLEGDSNRQLRMQVYKFMLNYMDLSNKALTIELICKEFLSNVSMSCYKLDDTIESILRDCFEILLSKEIRAYDMDQVGNDMEEKEEEVALEAEINVRRVTLVEPVMLELHELYRCVFHHTRHNLLPDIYNFMFELLQDYQKDIPKLITNKYLLNEMNLMLQNEARQEAILSRRRDANRGITNVTQNDIVAELMNSRAPPQREEDAESIPDVPRPSRPSIRQPLNLDSDHEMMDVDMPSTSKGFTGYPGLDDPLLSSTPRVVLQKLGGHPNSDDPQLSSTPRVVLQKLSKFSIANMSRITAAEDSD